MAISFSTRTSTFFLLLLFITIIFLLQATCALSKASEVINSDTDLQQCSGNHEEDKILCDAAKIKDESIKKVVEEDEASRIENDTPSSDRAQDVWTTAYDQWIGKGSKQKTDSINRAINEAQKSNPSTKAKETLKTGETDKQSLDSLLLDQDDDELTVITSAVRSLSDKLVTSEIQRNSLSLIEDLCYSGDNGRQVEAMGGVETILKLVSDTDTDVGLKAVKAIATCSQNNPQVFNKAIERDSIPILLQRAVVHDNDEWRASVLRALVALSDGGDANQTLFSEKDKLLSLLFNSFGTSSPNGRRSRIRALALIEQCLRIDRAKWLQPIQAAGIGNKARDALNSDDVDTREGSARVLKLLR